ncbi:MAG: type II CRISPR RNA-guided endonuclease Cas9 [Alphaproteobacteria bacterium]|nr:type II CRISPR RNA-guided endonuclease Cas9 [Alphaproteobacteria bacterium]
MFVPDQKKYRIGIDVGTASVAVVAIAVDDRFDQEFTDQDYPPNYDPTDENDETSYGDYQYLTHRLRLFDEPVDNNKGTLVSKNTARRVARMARRQIARRGGRLGALRDLGYKYKLIVAGDEFTKPSSTPLPELRAKAATEKVSLTDLMRIILRLSKRRGYKGEFRERAENKMGEVEFGAHELAKQLGSRTLGQYLYQDRYLRGKTTKLKLDDAADDKKSAKNIDANSNIERNMFALRRMVEAEFDIIWQTQSRFHPQLQGAAGAEIGKNLRDTLFHQRPLKSVAGMVANCTLEPTLPRAPKAQMAFQRFRIEKTLADMRWATGKQARHLSPAQKDVIRKLCQSQKTVSFKSIIEALEMAGCPKPVDRGLNLDSSHRPQINGNETLAAWRELDAYAEKNQPDFTVRLYDEFTKMDASTQISVINFLADITPDVFASENWPDLFPRFNGKNPAETALKRSKNAALIKFVNQLRPHDNFDHLSKMGFPKGRASYSVKALNKLSDHMENHRPELQPAHPTDCEIDRGDEESAIHFCYRHASTRRCDNAEPIATIKTLPAAPLTGSAVVDGAMRQIRIAVNEIIDEVGCPPAEIVIEMAREMSLGVKNRNERTLENSKNQNLRTKAKNAIIGQGLAPTKTNITRWLLWHEQNEEFCPYCEVKISLEAALSPNTEIDHIIPRKLTQVGRKLSEIVLVHHDCNQQKGSRTPFMAWGNTDRFESVKKAAARFEKNRNYRKAKILLLEDYESEVLNDESINGFADRQFHQTAWIAKAALAWMEPLCPGRVSVSRGAMTDLLRANWGLNTVIPEMRYQEQRKVFDTGGTLDPDSRTLAEVKEITEDDFKILRKYLEGHPPPPTERDSDKASYPGFDFDRRIDKRIDHRHHIIDALVIAMTSRRTFQKMARDYKFFSESEARKLEGESQDAFEKRIKKKMKNRMRTPRPPIRHLRDVARSIISNPNITVKPDRYVGGRFVQATAYRYVPPEKANHDGKAVLASRCRVLDLLGKSDAEMERNISDIVSPETRDAVRNEIAERRMQGLAHKDLKQSLIDTPIQHPVTKQPIKKVFCKQRTGRGFVSADKENLVEVIHGKDSQHRKYYLRDGYAYIDVLEQGGKFVSAIAVANIDAEKRRGQPKPANIRRIYKKDTLRDKRDGKLYVVQQIRQGGQIALTHIYETRTFGQMDASDGNQIATGKGLINFEVV